MAISIVFVWPFFKGYPNICHPAKDRKIMDSRVPTGKFWRVQRLFFPLDLPRLGEAANLWSLKKKQFWRMEAKSLKNALQVLLKCDFWTSKKSWKPPLTFMEEWYLGSDISDCWEKNLFKQMFSNKILGSSSLKGWSLNSCSQLPKITTSLATNQVVTPQRHQIFHLNGPHSEAVVRVGLSTGVASFVPLALERKLHRVWRVPNGKKKIHPQIRTVGTPLAKRTSWWFFPLW